IAIDNVADRLEMAVAQGAITIDFDEVDPVEAVRGLSNGYGADACIDAVGVDAQAPHHGPAARQPLGKRLEHLLERTIAAPRRVLFSDQWQTGDAPSQALSWSVEAVRKSGVVSIIGVYPDTA